MRPKAAVPEPEQPRWTTVVLCSALVLCTALITLYVAASLWLSGIISDTLYFPALQKDLTEGKYPIFGWAVSPSPYWFPDGILYAAAAVVTPNWAAAVGLSCVFMWLLTLASGVWLGREILNDWRRPALLVPSVGALLALFSTTFIWRPLHSMIFWHLSYPGLHGAAIAAGLAVAAASLRFVRGAGHPLLPAFTGLVTAAMFVSDRLFVTQFLLPLWVTMVVLAVLRSIPPRRLGHLIAAGAAGLLIGIALDHFVLGRLFYRPAPPLRQLAADAQFELFFTMLRELWHFGVSDAPLLAIPVTGLVFALWDCKVLRARERRDVGQQFLPLLLVLVTVFTLAAPVITGLWYGIMTVRYVLPLFVLPALYLAIVVFPRLKVKPNAIALGTVAICAIAAAASGEKLPALEVPYPQEIRCVDQLAQQKNLHAGISGYWAAKRITVLSRAGLLINQIDTALQPMLISNNPWWFRGPRTQNGYAYPRYDFALVDELDRNAVLDWFGAPAEQHQCGTYSVWLYNRPTDVYFRNFLRAQSIEITEGAAALSAYEPVDRKTVEGTRLLASYGSARKISVVEFNRAAPENVTVVLKRGAQSVSTLSVARGARYLEVPGDGVQADSMEIVPQTSGVQFSPGMRAY